MTIAADIAKTLTDAVDRQRLIDTAIRLIAAPSWTGEAGKACECLAQILVEDGFSVERPTSGHESAPAVATRLHSSGPGSGRSGRVLQFNGHLDTVHLPFVGPEVRGDRITGSGASDMKGGIAAAVEALRILRDTKTLAAGSVLLTAHDLHEAPWGAGQQLDQLIRDGYLGDGVLLPEPLCDCLPVVGRGGATWKVTIRRPGPPVHEVMRPMDEPSVIAAGAELVSRLGRLEDQLAAKSDPIAGTETVFVGQIHSGEIFNQYPQECLVEGTRRWLPGTKRADVEAGLRDLFAELTRDTGVTVQAEFRLMRDAFRLDENDHR